MAGSVARLVSPPAIPPHQSILLANTEPEPNHELPNTDPEPLHDTGEGGNEAAARTGGGARDERQLHHQLV